MERRLEGWGAAGADTRWTMCGVQMGQRRCWVGRGSVETGRVWKGGAARVPIGELPWMQFVLDWGWVSRVPAVAAEHRGG